MNRFLTLPLGIVHWVVLANALAQEYSHHRYQRLGRPEGLENPFVQAILQDHQGFMWLGTEDGLYKYDGYTVRAFRPHPAQAFYIRSMSQDERGVIWIATQGTGLNAFDPQTETFRKFSHDPSTPSIHSMGLQTFGP